MQLGADRHNPCADSQQREKEGEGALLALPAPENAAQAGNA